MALALYDRVQETTTTTGTGTLTLAGAVSGFQSFAVVGNGNTCYYAVVDGAAWEVGIGTYTSSGTTLARTTILANSNGNTSAITLAAGSKPVFLTYPAGKSVNLDASGNVSALGTIASGTWQATAVGLAYGGTGKATAPAAMANLMGFTTTATAAGTTVLTNTSSYYQLFTGSTTQTITLPVTNTLQTGWTFHICNNSTGNLTLNSSGGNLVITILPGSTVMCTCIGTSLTTAADWEAGYTDFSTATGTGAVVLATSPTLTTPNINSAQFATVSGTAPLYAARAWVNFNGTGTVAIRSSGNVTSITDGGTGLYTVNFTTAMSDANYAAVAATGQAGTTAATQQQPSVYTYTASAVSISSVQGSTRAFSDASEVSVVVFR